MAATVGPKATLRALPLVASTQISVHHRGGARVDLALTGVLRSSFRQRSAAMADIPRLNGVIRALEQGQPAFTTFAAAEVSVAQAVGAAHYDGVVFEMEHRAYDIRALRDCLQYMLDRRQIAQSASLAPAVTPFVRIPPNGGEASQWVAKQVLDHGVYGIVWPHVSTVEEARNAVVSCRYPRPRTAAYYEPAGQRGDAPAAAARYWGLSQQEYYDRAD